MDELLKHISAALTVRGVTNRTSKNHVITCIDTTDPSYRTVQVWVQKIHSSLIRLTLFVNGFNEDDTTYFVCDWARDIEDDRPSIDIAEYIATQWSGYIEVHS